jgi:hypothetical protein
VASGDVTEGLVGFEQAAPAHNIVRLLSKIEIVSSLTIVVDRIHPARDSSAIEVAGLRMNRQRRKVADTLGRLPPLGHT